MPLPAAPQLLRFLEEYSKLPNSPTKWTKMVEFLKNVYPSILNEVGSFAGQLPGSCLLPCRGARRVPRVLPAAAPGLAASASPCHQPHKCLPGH